MAVFLEKEAPGFWAKGRNKKRGTPCLRAFKILEYDVGGELEHVWFIVYGYNLLPDAEYISWKFEGEKEALVFVDEYDCSLLPFGYEITTAWLAPIPPQEGGILYEVNMCPQGDSCEKDRRSPFRFGDLDSILLAKKYEYEKLGKRLLTKDDLEKEERSLLFEEARTLSSVILVLYARTMLYAEV